ncbi:radical SAM/SPASM domain-containing protein [Paramaledivibacter caminithermalis]|uniref:Radical SAM additional 4Fe4S-binding SPASM domain-containing protein n=1 Tax=Paramaledivibacter caminithermalis (strain DSM 15212 / CIP 107654 / DViRD3) TaxID=1121301 RepID=A0A1M6RC20_PARC5|nr:radical SAM protein [Paramaledivibacter caminithermalis]SHK29950.1 radical SAM additional 4Fe4S-binding SPASM domain-containing protein [Paramaledivibacter caminithermalis DSM 15212]
MNTNEILSFPLIVKWNITSKCNLRCKHCFLSNYSHEDPELLKIKNFVKDLSKKKIASIHISGGEPLMRSDLEEIIKIISANNISLLLASNGTLLTNNRIKRLINSGLLNYQISLDGHNREINDYIRGNGAFDKTIKSIKELKIKGAKIILAYTLNKINYLYFDEIIKLAENLNVDALRFELFIPLGSGKNNKSELDLDNESLKFLKKKMLSATSNRVKLIFPLFNSEFGCGAGYFSCVINSDFTVSPCDMLIETQKTSPIHSVDELQDIWKNSEFFQNWRNFKINDDYCNTCDYVSKCNYGCRASALAYNSNFNSHDRLCLFRSK